MNRMTFCYTTSFAFPRIPKIAYPLIYSNVFVVNYQIPKLVLLELKLNRGNFVLSHPDSIEDMEISPKDLVYKSDNIIECSIYEAKMKLLHLGPKYDQWIRKVFQNEYLKLVYYYSETKPLRPVREKYYPKLLPEFKPTDFATCNFNTQATLLSWASIDDVQSRGVTKLRKLD